MPPAKRKLKSHYAIGEKAGKKRRPKSLGPCSYCGRSHHTRCWKKYEDKQKAKKHI